MCAFYPIGSISANQKAEYIIVLIMWVCQTNSFQSSSPVLTQLWDFLVNAFQNLFENKKENWFLIGPLYKIFIRRMWLVTVIQIPASRNIFQFREGLLDLESLRNDLRMSHSNSFKCLLYIFDQLNYFTRYDVTVSEHAHDQSSQRDTGEV